MNDVDQKAASERRNSNRDRSAIQYTNSVLSGSMTFIKSHAEALQRYTPVYAGANRVSGLELPTDRVYTVNDQSLLGIWKEFIFRKFGFAPAFVEKLKRHNPAVVHAHFGTSGPSGMMLAERLDVPLIVTFHGKDATMNERELERSWRGRELLRRRGDLLRRTDLFIAVSNFIRQRLVDQGYPEEKVELHRNGIDLDFFRPPSKEARQRVVLFVGRFTEKKGAKYLIEAAAQLQNSGVDFELVMLGDGPSRPDLEKAADQARLRCRFTGFLPTEDVRQWIGTSTVVAVPSVTAANGDSEGLPTILLEAQAMETPVVATRHSGIPEGVRESVTADLVPERDVQGLAVAIGSFLKLPQKAETFGKAGRKFVTENFDLRVQVEWLEDKYSELSLRHESTLQK